MFKLNDLVKATGAKLIQKTNFDSFKGISTDSRSIRSSNIFFALEGKNFDGHDFVQDAVNKGAKAVVISKKVEDFKQKVNMLMVKDTTIALGRLAKQHRRINNIPLIAITGSTGKTTTKDVISDILSNEYRVLKNFGTRNNHIGVPKTIFKINSSHDICVLELGTNHFGEISYLSSIASPQIAVITNIGASHLEFLKNINGVFREKKSIISHLRKPKILLLNGDDSFLRKIKPVKGIKIFYFGQDRLCDFKASAISVENGKVSFIFNKKHRFHINSLGRFNVYNALAGIGCGIIFGIGIKNIIRTMDNFQFPQNRLNKIVCSKFCILDDTYNSNPLSLMGAIESLAEFKTKGRRILVMGDMLELGKSSTKLHKHIGGFIANKPIDMLITLGELSRSTADVVRLRSKNTQSIFTFDSKVEIIDFLRSRIKSGDTLLIKGSRLLGMEDITTSLVNREK